MRTSDREPRVYQPDFGDEERSIVAKANRKLAQGVAKRVLAEFGITAPPVPIEELIQKRGVTLVRVAEDIALSGAIHREQREIVINTFDRAMTRQRFTMAHELGHLELNHSTDIMVLEDSVGFDGPFGDSEQGEPKDPREVEANAFAAELLMPSSWIRQLPKGLTGYSPDRLATQYQVSLEAMFHQLMACSRF